MLLRLKSAAKSTANVQPSSASQKTSATSLSKQSVASAANLEAKLADQKTAVNDIKPIAYTTQERATVSQGYQLTDADAARFIQNASDLEKAGAKLSWESTPDTSGSNNSTVTSTGNVVVTYKDGTKTVVPVSFYVDQHVALNQLSSKGGYNYYYVDQVGKNVTSMDTPDDNGNVLYDPNDQVGSKHSLLSVVNTVGSTPQDYKFSLSQPLDTSTKGIHWATVNVDVSHVPTTGAFGNILGNYTIKVPYIVEGLNLKKGIPVDNNGNPIITAQLESDEAKRTLGFDPTQNASSLGQYFYQDYDLAYALGIRTTVVDFTKPTDLVNTKTNSFKMLLSGLGSQTAQTVDVNYATNATMDDYYFFNQKGFMPNGKPYIYGQSRIQNINYLNENFNGTNDAVNHLGKVTVNGQTVTSTLIDHVGSDWRNGAGSNGIFNLKLRLTFAQENTSGQPVIFSNSSFNIKNQVAGTDNFVNRVNKWTNDLYVTPKTGVALQLAEAGATTYSGVKTNTDGKQLHAIILYPSEKTTNVDVDITNNKFDLNTAIAPLIQNPTNADGKHPLSQPILDNNTTWPAGTTFKFVSDDGQEVPVKAGQTYTGKIVVTLPGGSQGTVENVSFHTKANVLTQDKSVYKGMTLTAKDLVTNTDVFPEGTTFQFANNSEPNWNTPGIYNAQITATYPDHTQTTSSANITVTNKTTDPAKSNVTVSDKMQFTITYWDDTDNKQLQKFNMSETQPGYDLNMHFTFDTGKYQFVGVTGVPDGVRFTASYKKLFTDPDADFTKPNYYWDNAADKLFGANITIHLKHKIQAIDDNKRSQSERTATVHYINGTTKQSIAPDVQITTYYKRSVKQDLVTDEYIYGPWQIDTSKGKQNGYNTDSQDVSFSNGTVSVKVPTVDGYTTPQNGNVVIDENGALPETTTIVYTANPQKFTVHYVDDDEKGKSVSDQVENGVTGQTLNNFVQIPENYQLANGQTEPTSYTFKAANNADVTVHLAHKVEQQTRTITVNYTKVKVNADGTYTSVGQAAPAAVLDVCYTTDLVTGKAVWDQSKNDDGYTNGYKVVSGTWTNLPQVWDISTPDKAAKSVVIASVPTLDGYTAYTGGPASNTNGVPANEFVYPAWNGSNGNISDTGKGSIAYTPNAPIYEAQATHTILYFSNQDLHQTETRTVTRNYKYAETNSSLDGTNVFPPAQLQVFYKRTGTFNSTLNKVVYTDWAWDTSAGDVDTPGFHVISGNWNNSLGSKDKPIGNASFNVATPTKDGYTAVTAASDGNYNTTTLSNPGYGPNEAYANNTNDVYFWCSRNNLTVFYVPSDKLFKTITRTINVTNPDGSTTNVTQIATVKRKAYLNNDATGQDTGVVFGDYGTDSTSWGAYSVPAQADYKAVITQTVTNPDGTKTTTTLDSIPNQTVGINTLPTTIDVTYVPTTNKRSVTFKFVDDNNGGTQVGDLVTINGQAGETVNDLSKLGLVVPTNYKLAPNQSDLPTTYTFNSPVINASVTVHLVHEILNTTETQARTITVHFKNVDTGKEVAPDAQVEVLYNRSVTKDLVTGKETDGAWQWDTSAKGSDAGTPGFHVLSGSWNLPKNGQATTFSVNAPDLSSDYITVQQSTGIYSTSMFATPTIPNVFTNNTDPTWYNRNELTTYYVPKKKITRTINVFKPGETQANSMVQTAAVGQNAKVNSTDTGVVYDGTWTTDNWSNYDVPTETGYTPVITQVVTNSDGTTTTTTLTSIASQTVTHDTLPTVINITYTATANATLSGNNHSTYTGKQITPDELNGGTIQVNVTGPDDAHSGKYTLKSGNVEFSSDKGQTWSTTLPTNAGNYELRLTDQGRRAIEKQFGNNSIQWTKDGSSTISGTATYTIDKAQATAKIDGDITREYNGQAVNGTTVYGQITWTGKDTSNNQDFTLKHDISASDYSWYTKDKDTGKYVKFDGQPVNAGTYYLILNKDYISKLDQANPNYDITSVDGAFIYTIDKATATLKMSGSQSENYNGQPIKINYSGFPLSITTSNKLPLTLPEGTSLDAEDVEITDANGNKVTVPTAIGTYTIKLTQTGLQKFESQTDNYDWVSAGFATLTITRNDHVSVTLTNNADGAESVVYTGKTTVIDPSKFTVTLGNGLTYQLKAGDLQFVKRRVLTPMSALTRLN